MKEIFLIRNSISNSTYYKKEVMTSSAFGIPEYLAFFLEEKIKIHENLRNYLFFLLNRYRFFAFSENFPKGNGIKSRYQPEGLNLQYFRFKPFNGDWIELRMLALSHSVSMTQFFVFLLELEFDGVGEIEDHFIGDKVPPIFLERPIRLNINLYRLEGNRMLRLKFGRRKYELDENCNSKYPIEEWRETE